jgi:hypothetical protein
MSLSVTKFWKEQEIPYNSAVNSLTVFVVTAADWLISKFQDLYVWIVVIGQRV